MARGCELNTEASYAGPYKIPCYIVSQSQRIERMWIMASGLAQIVFRFPQQIGMLPLTGTSNPQHMTEDLACDQFTLSPDELHAIQTIGL